MFYLISIILILQLPVTIYSVEGPNVCVKEKIEVQTIKVPEKVPRTVQVYEFCTTPPFKCKVEKTEWVDGFTEKIVHVAKNYSDCCDGYTQPLGRQICVPICSDQCLHGICSQPDVCECKLGWTGSKCDMRCPSGKKGSNCKDFCNCHHGSSCDSETGVCHCKPGWTGEDCSKPCLQGLYGPNCSQKCLCKNNAECDAKTGKCICNAGFRGEVCQIECENTADPECEESCHCQNNGTCAFAGNYVKCDCKPGYYGNQCERTCPLGTYGPDCINQCECDLNHNICDAESGCIPLPLRLGATLSSTKNDSLFIITSGLLLAIICLMLIVYGYRERCKKLKTDKAYVTFVAKDPSDHVDNPVYSFSDISNTRLYNPSTSTMKSHFNSLKSDLSLLNKQGHPEKWLVNYDNSPPPPWESLGAHARSPQDRIENIYLNLPEGKSTSSSSSFYSKEPLYAEIKGDDNFLKLDDSTSTFYDEPKSTQIIEYNDLNKDDTKRDEV